MVLLCVVLVRIGFAFVVIGLALVLHIGSHRLYIGFVGFTIGLTQSVFLHSHLHGHHNAIFTVHAKFCSGMARGGADSKCVPLPTDPVAHKFLGRRA